MAAFAFYLKSESGDGYLTPIEMKNFKGSKDVVDFVVSQCPEELAYISEWSIAMDYHTHGDKADALFKRIREEFDNQLEQARKEYDDE